MKDLPQSVEIIAIILVALAGILIALLPLIFQSKVKYFSIHLADGTRRIIYKNQLDVLLVRLESGDTCGWHTIVDENGETEAVIKIEDITRIS